MGDLMAKPCGAASTTSLIAAQRTCSAPSLLTRLWCWRILIVMKSPNEIPAVQTLLGSLPLSDAVVTVDAMLLSKKAFEHAAAGSVHLIAQVKANQPALHHAVAELCNKVAPLDINRTTDKRCDAATKPAWSRYSAPGNSLAGTEWDGHISAVIRVNRDILTRFAITGLWRSTSETALFVSDVAPPAAQCAKAIRDHWSIENRYHAHPRR